MESDDRQMITLHPGRELATLMKERRLTVDDLVRAGISPRIISDLLSLQVNCVSPDTVAKLCAITQTDPEFWNAAQARYSRPVKGCDTRAVSRIWGKS